MQKRIPDLSVLRWGLLLFAIFVACPAFARTWKISRFDDHITVMDDGTMLIDEQIRLSFEGTFNGIYRTIPIQYPGPNTTNYTLFVNVQSVTDENGKKLDFSKSTSGNFLKLKINVPGTDTERVVRLQYKVRNGIRYFSDHDELYWNVTGNDWPVTIDSASAFVSLPPGVSGLKAQAFTGGYGSRAQEATAEVSGANASFDTTNPLLPRAGMTIDIYIPKGMLKEPSWFTRNVVWFLGSNPIAFLPLWTFAVMFGIWYLKGRDPDPGMSVAPMYEPPKGFTPAEAGTLIDDQIQARDITSTLIDLAVRGYLKIEEQESRVLLFTRKDYIFRLQKPPAEWADVTAYEREILNNMFSDGGLERSLSSLKNKFYIALPSIRTQIMSALKSKDMYATDPDSAKGLIVVGVLLIALPPLWLQMTGRANLFASVLVTVVALVLSAIVVFIFGRLMTANTLRGARTKVQVLGFREFMTRVDADRIRRMPPDTFEKYLPYAMAFGVEKHWAQAFQGIIKEPPSWYTGTGYPGMGWNPVMFTNSMSDMSNTAYQAFSAAPQASSTGSGFGSGGSFGGGGGFSGGGFGGGGGDAF